MQTIDCYWEKENLGVTAREIVFAEGECFNPEAVEAAAAGVAYAVVKAPVGDPSFPNPLLNKWDMTVQLHCTLLQQKRTFGIRPLLHRLIYMKGFRPLAQWPVCDACFRRMH